MIVNLILFTVLISCASCWENIEKAFKYNQVIPDVIRTAPGEFLEVQYPRSGKEAYLGNELAPREVKDIPEVKYYGDPDSFYTLIMTDPDVPSRRNPTESEFNHWLVVNIPGSKVSQGETINGYVGAGPPLDTGLHRYIFLLYKQPKKLTFDEPRRSSTDANRMGLKMKKFVMKYNLGEPVAGNFFQAKHDDYVPELYKQLGLSA